MILREIFTLLGFRTDASGAQAYEASLKDLKELALGASVAVAAIGAAAAASVAELLSYAGATKDTATAIGISAEALQELDFAAKIGGASAEALRTGLQNIGAAAAGMTPKGKAVAVILRDIGVATKDSEGRVRPAEDLFSDLAGALYEIDDPGKKAAIAMRVFGDAGRALIPLLSEGPEGLASLREEARALGLVISGETIDAAEDLGDQIDKVTGFVVGLSRTFAAALLPTIKPMIYNFLEWAKANRAILASDIEGLARDLASAFGALASTASVLAQMIFNIVQSFGGLSNVILIIVAGFAILNIAMFPAIVVFGLAAAAMAALAIVVEDIAMFERYGDEVDTLTGRLKKMFVDEPISWKDSGLVIMLKIVANLLNEIAEHARRAAKMASYLFTLGKLGVDAAFDTELSDVGAAQDVNETINAQKITWANRLRGIGFSVKRASALTGVSESIIDNNGIIVESLAAPVISSPVAPTISRPNAAGGKTTYYEDRREYNVTVPGTSDPEATATHVAEKLRDLNIAQVAE